MRFEEILKKEFERIKEKTEKERIEKQKQEQKRDYYINLLRDINNCKSVIEDRKKSKQDYSAYQYRLDCLNYKLSTYKKKFFNEV